MRQQELEINVVTLNVYDVSDTLLAKFLRAG